MPAAGSIDTTPLRFRIYLDIVRMVESIMVTSQEEWRPIELIAVAQMLTAMKHQGALIQSSVDEKSIKICVHPGMEYLEKKVGNSPWVVRTPFEEVAILEVERT